MKNQTLTTFNFAFIKTHDSNLSSSLFLFLFLFSLSLSLAPSFHNDFLHRRHQCHHQPRSLQNGGYHRRFTMDIRLDPPLPLQIIITIISILLYSFDFITNNQRKPRCNSVSRRGGEIPRDDKRHVRSVSRRS